MRQYTIKLCPAGAVLAIHVFDADGSHGTPGALVDTFSIMMSPQLEAFVYRYAEGDSHDRTDRQIRG